MKPDSDMIQVLQLPYKEFKITLISNLLASVEKVAHIHEHTGDFMEQIER